MDGWVHKTLLVTLDVACVLLAALAFNKLRLQCQILIPQITFGLWLPNSRLLKLRSPAPVSSFRAL